MRVNIVSDVHGADGALAKAAEGSDVFVCLGDLILFLDYDDPEAGAASLPVVAFRREILDAHAVGDQYCVTAHMPNECPSGLCAHGDAAAQLLHGCLRDVIPGRQDPRSIVRGMPRGHQWPSCRPAGE